MKLLYLTPGCFDKGGISRYNRYQISCIRELYGEDNVRVISLLGPDQNNFEDPFDVYWHGGSSLAWSKITILWVILSNFIFWKPKVVLNAHVNFSGVIVVFCYLFGSKNILNVYGSEVWSGLRPDTRMGLLKSDFVISDCHNTANYVKAHFRENDEIIVIWDCVDLNKFRYDENRFDHIKTKYQLPDRDNHFVVLTLGRMSEETDYKGYTRLIDVLDRVRGKGRNVELIMAGSGSLVNSLKERARKLGVSPYLSFTGSVDEEDIGSLYSYAHLFSLVTESGIGMGEGIPLTPLEAMACHTPIIVGNQDGSKEAVFEPRNGYVIDPKDLDLHAEIICQLADNTELRSELGANAEIIAREYFSYELFKEKHKKLLDSLLRN